MRTTALAHASVGIGHATGELAAKLLTRSEGKRLNGSSVFVDADRTSFGIGESGPVRRLYTVGVTGLDANPD